MSPNLFDRSTTLCLACSSSLPPLKGTFASFSNANSIHITNCCQKPICPSCIASNPRLARYDPCLACLGGVDVVGSGSAGRNRTDSKGKTQILPGIGPSINLDGSVRDQDTFVLGDDEDEDSEQLNEPQDRGAPPPPYEPGLHGKHTAPSDNPEEADPSLRLSLDDQGLMTQDPEPHITVSANSTRTTPYKYYLNRTDTLQGISLRFGLDGHEICKLNNLPPNVIQTTPHLLHTRTFLLLPPSAKPHPSLTMSTAEEKGREDKLVRERAEKKLQTLTKEVDWHVAKAYVALADDAQEQEAFSAKRKEMGASGVDSKVGATSRASGLEALAIEQYLDDEEWEAEQRQAGRTVQVLPFPMKGQQKTHKDVRRWWDRKK